MGQYLYNTTLYIICNIGFKRTTIPSFSLCTAEGHWSVYNPQCVKVTCSVYIFENNNVLYTPIEHYTGNIFLIDYNTTLYPVCKDGFTPKSGHIPRKCELDGQLSGHEPICTRKACVAVNHLEVNISGYSVHVSGPFLYEETKIVEYNHSLFYHVNGSLSVSCAVNGSLKWQHGKPPDLRKICILPKTIPNGIVNHSCLSDDKCEQGTTIRIECYEGFSTSNTYVKCLPSHSWNGDLFCEKLSTFETQTVAIASAASVGTLLIVASAIAFAVFLHRRKRKEHTKNKCTLHKPTNVLNVISETVNIGRAVETKDNTEYATSTAHFGLTRDEEAGMEKSYYSIGDRVKLPDNAIKVENLYDIIFSSESKETMKTQFKIFPKGLTEDYQVALKPQNRQKNRYKSIYPYDETRVILQKYGSHISDYTNANYIHGYNQTRAYIASQGPTKEVLVDFWRMIWQLRVGKVVMLTNLEENKTMKCIQYWPEADSVNFDDYKVTTQGEENYSDFIIRTLIVEKTGEGKRKLFHFHFTAWPDKSVPKYASSLVHFRHKVETTPVKENGPVIVHCSAGVGRTGTFIALNILTEQASTMGYVDPVGCVNTLRRQRVDMVQTPDQYIFLHMALLETLMLSTSALSASRFLKYYEELMAFDNHLRKRKIDIEFSRMEKMSPVADECQYVSAKEVRNRKKNRYSNILPVADHMPYLTPSGKRSEPDYINAVFLPNYKKKGAFIVTQTPLKATKTDFWRLVVEHDVHTIIMMNNMSEMKEDEIYWPVHNESETYENMTITKTSEDCEGGLRKIMFDFNRFEKLRKLQQ
ncbi:receptor-type tyrosine-protein phosphatase kappa-like [Mya arenaria]|uniref:receptor-type tyrosine-protein phosphatase kappa-like n=1 Tax=Mya arenaria TaxID=6604 RepID=UPI0022E1D6E9|nr:receptor-type tyrosine-protein phosphatase kappa-like [Mya arenaria]